MSSHHHDCGGHGPSPSVHQTLDELDFERGVWSAAMDGETGRVEKYLRDGGDVNAMDSSGYTALHYAARSGHEETCRVLLANYANVNVQTRSGGATPLHRTAYQGHFEVTRLLLDRGANVKIVDSDGKTPLHKAAERGKLDVCKLLLSRNSDCKNIKDSKGKIPIDYVSESNSELRELLQGT